MNPEETVSPEQIIELLEGHPNTDVILGKIGIIVAQSFKAGFDQGMSAANSNNSN